MTWKQTWFTISGMDGLILPGMIDDPGCTAGSLISSMPVRGPMTMRRRSLAILLRSIASTRIAALKPATSPMLCMSWMRSCADAQIEPGDLRAGTCSSARDTPSRRSRRCRRRCRRCRDRAGSRRPRCTRRRPRSIEPAYAVNSWPRRIGIASCRCVRPAFTMSSNSRALRGERIAQRLERRRRTPSSCDRHASRMFVGIVSLVLCAMFT